MSHQALPWQVSIWKRLRERQADGKLPHALLFTGPSGVGKRELAMAFMQATLCDRTEGTEQACGACNACRQVLAGSHPDMRIVEPEKDSKTFTLKVDQIRELVAFMALKSQYSGSRFAIIDPADGMNENAANALLKTLEEPGADSILILLTSLPGKLLPTIRSRCQSLPFPVPAESESLPWMLATKEGLDAPTAQLLLGLSGGAPVSAAQMASNESLATRQELASAWLDLVRGRGSVIATAGLWSQQDGKQVLPWLISWIQDLMRLSVDAEARIHNLDLQEALLGVSRVVDSKDIARRLDEAELALKRTGGSLNPQLLFEDLLTSWNGLARSA